MATKKQKTPKTPVEKDPKKETPGTGKAVKTEKQKVRFDVHFFRDGAEVTDEAQVSQLDNQPGTKEIRIAKRVELSKNNWGLEDVKILKWEGLAAASKVLDSPEKAFN